MRPLYFHRHAIYLLLRDAARKPLDPRLVAAFEEVEHGDCVRHSLRGEVIVYGIVNRLYGIDVHEVVAAAVDDVDELNIWLRVAYPNNRYMDTPSLVRAFGSAHEAADSMKHLHPMRDDAVSSSTGFVEKLVRSHDGTYVLYVVYAPCVLQACCAYAP
jgi:hypothetical protein